MRAGAAAEGDCPHSIAAPGAVAMETGLCSSAWLALLLCLAGGCGGNSPATVPVSGRATLDGHE